MTRFRPPSIFIGRAHLACYSYAMNIFLNILLLIIANLIGFLSTSVVWYSMVIFKFVDIEAMAASGDEFQTKFIAGTLMVWLVCALLSIIAMFIKTKWKYVIILAPAVIPYIYGFSILVMLAGSASS